MDRNDSVERAGRSVMLIMSASVLSVATGCSFAMNVVPSDPSRRTAEAARECTSSVAAPIVDSISAAVGAYNTGVAAGATEGVSIYGISMKRSTGLALGVTQLAAFGIAATYGFVQASRCHALRNERHLDAPAPPSSGAGDGPRNANAASSEDAADTGADDAPAELPSWSAFRRVELEPSHSHPAMRSPP